jgi:SAM-dependent methyltransferase
MEAAGTRPEGPETEATRALLVRFLSNRSERTLNAYRIDIEDFARFLGQSAEDAVARLLRSGPSAGGYLTLEYAIDLRQRDRAPATVGRRLATLRALVTAAGDVGLTDWALATPGEDEITAAIQERAGQASYVLPRHPSEVDRLDLQHYALRAAMRATHLAPLDGADRILDVGCGTGQWGFELCRQFPEALVVGLDLVPGKSGGPARHHGVRANLLQGLPFRDEQFDFVHQRLLVTGIPIASWPAAVADLVRVTRPGGWVELVEPNVRVQGGGPATDRLLDLAMGMAAVLALDTTGVVFEALDGYARDAGLERVTRRQLDVPIGHWGGDVGALMATDIRAASTRVCEVLQARSRLTAEEGRELIERAQLEWEQRRTSWTFAVVFGRKPV